MAPPIGVRVYERRTFTARLRVRLRGWRRSCTTCVSRRAASDAAGLGAAVYRRVVGRRRGSSPTSFRERVEKLRARRRRRRQMRKDRLSSSSSSDGEGSNFDQAPSVMPVVARRRLRERAAMVHRAPEEDGFLTDGESLASAPCPPPEASTNVASSSSSSSIGDFRCHGMFGSPLAGDPTMEENNNHSCKARGGGCCARLVMAMAVLLNPVPLLSGGGGGGQKNSGGGGGGGFTTLYDPAGQQQQQCGSPREMPRRPRPRPKRPQGSAGRRSSGNFSPASANNAATPSRKQQQQQYEQVRQQQQQQLPSLLRQESTGSKTASAKKSRRRKRSNKAIPSSSCDKDASSPSSPAPPTPMRSSNAASATAKPPPPSSSAPVAPLALSSLPSSESGWKELFAMPPPNFKPMPNSKMQQNPGSKGPVPLLSFPHLNVPPPPLPPPPPPPAVKRSISAPAAVEDARFEGGVEKFNESFKDLRSIWGEAGGDHREGPSPPETPRTPLEALSGGETAAAFPFNTPMENSLPPSEENLESSRYSLFGKDCDSSKLASALWGSSVEGEQDLDNCVVYAEAFLHLMGLAKHKPTTAGRDSPSEVEEHRPCNLLGEDDSASAAANESYARVDKWVREAKEEFEATHRRLPIRRTLSA